MGEGGRKELVSVLWNPSKARYGATGLLDVGWRVRGGCMERQGKGRYGGSVGQLYEAHSA